MTAELALAKFMTILPAGSTVLDVGSGTGEHARMMQCNGFKVTTLSYEPPADIVCDFAEYNGPEYDAVWASHVLEHQLNVNQFLRNCHRHLKEGGLFAVTVPPAKKQVVGGHVSMWNAGTLLYNLILAGFDCRMSKICTYGYNVSVLVRKSTISLPKLRYDNGDIETLSRFFPFKAEQGFNGEIVELNWND